MADDVTLVPVSPFYRLHWIDGTHFEYSNDDAALTGEIVKLDPGDVAGYRRFLDYSRDAYEEGYGKLGHVAFDLRSMARPAPALEIGGAHVCTPATNAQLVCRISLE